MGNSTRCYAIIQELIEKGVEIYVATSGNGLSFFKDKSEIKGLYEIESFFYSVKKNKISALATLFALPQLLKKAIKKNQQVKEIIKQIKPHIIITDSEYSTSFARRNNIPVIGINNSDIVVLTYFSTKIKPISIAPHFFIIELMDYFFHRFFVDAVISPSPIRHKTLHNRIKRVGLILRREIVMMAKANNQFQLPREVKRVLCMLSGSALGMKDEINWQDLPYEVDIIGRTGISTNKVRYHGKITNNLSLLKEANLMIINAGFSAVSEALALNKPTLVLPLPNHAEQFTNAILVKELGRGNIIKPSEIISTLQLSYEKNSWVNFKPYVSEMYIDGAKEAANYIIDLLKIKYGGK